MKRLVGGLGSGVAKKRLAGLLLAALILGLFFSFNRFPKLDTVREDLDAVSGPVVECFQGFCIEAEPDTTFVERWWDFSLEYLLLVAPGMAFAFLIAGLTESFLFPPGSGLIRGGGVIGGTLRGLGLGPVLNLCSACIVPISASFKRRTGPGGSAGAIALVQSSSTMNLPALVMVAMIFAPMLSGSRIVLSVVGALLLGPLVAAVVGERRRASEPDAEGFDLPDLPMSWGDALREATVDWAKASFSYLVKMGPIMVAAGFLSGLVVQWIDADLVSTYLGNHLLGVAIAATIGILINVPLLFEIPLVVLLLLLGMGVAPAATLLFTAAAGGPVTFWGLARVMPKRAIAVFATGTWVVGLAGGLIVWAIPDTDSGLRPGIASADNAVASEGAWSAENTLSPAEQTARNAVFRGEAARYSPFEVLDRPEASNASVTPFTDMASEALGADRYVVNDRPGAVVFDYDRDGDLDLYVTSQRGYDNLLFRNDGSGGFEEVGEESGLSAHGSHSTGAVACDLNNDGFQDLYVASWGDPKDRLGFRSAEGRIGAADNLFLNNGDGTFTNITETAFGESVNYRSGASVVCGDMDLDGWPDLFVANLADDDFRDFLNAHHVGHYNVLYRNNGDLTFSQIAAQAGVRGGQIVMRDPDGSPILFEDPVTGELYEGWNPAEVDDNGNRVGEPTAQTHAATLFDYDDDGDQDLWVASDGDRLRIYRNDSSPGNIQFTEVSRAMGVDKVGSWMGFGIGDYDGDADLDVFVTNVGYHPLTRAPRMEPNGSCEYHMRFAWGTCFHALLRNEGVRDLPEYGTVGRFVNAAASTVVEPSPIMPPASLDPDSVLDAFEAPTGLEAYDFGFGNTFFDYDNDGDQDLYWLGSTLSGGEGARGGVFPGPGRLLRGNGQGSFEDITVRARVLDIVRVDYSILDPDDPRFDATAQRIEARFHENGKGVAHGDFNGDGYVDLVGTNSHSELPQLSAGRGRQEGVSQGPIFLWINGGGENNWLTLRLRGRMAIDGTGSNADGIGARVYVKSSDALGRALVQVQEARAGSSYLSMDSADLEFGLGSGTEAEEIVVFWPSGVVQTLESVSANQVLEMVEPAE